MKRTRPNWGRVILPITFFIAIALLLALPLMRSTAANPTLTNADFETGPFDQGTTVTGWTVTGHAGDASSQGGTNGTSHAAALSAGADSSGDSIAQNFATVTSTTYNVDFDSGIFGKRTGSALQVEVQVLGSGNAILLDQLITPPDAGTFVGSQVQFNHYSFPFTANGSSSTIKFISVGSGNANADQMIDSVSITMAAATTPTPTPTATPIGGTTSCNAQGAVADACYQIRPPPCTSGQAFWFPNADCNIPEGTDCVNPQSNPSTGTDGFKYIFAVGPNNPAPAPGTFTENSNTGTATLTGHLESVLHPGYGFDVNVSWTGLTTNPNLPGGNGPLLELQQGCYVAPFGNGGPVNPATWHFYTGVSNATLTGTGNYAGAVIQLIPVMHFFQVGNGASNKNVNFGMSGWFTWNIVSQPTNPMFCIRTPAQTGGRTADFNLNCTPPACTGQIGDFVWQDNNGNGCQDADEPGIPGVQVDLISGCHGTQVIQTTHTDSTGHYLFSNLCHGDYTVRFTTPNGFTHTVANAACNVNGQPPDTTDSDCACTGTTSPCDVCVTLPTDSSVDLTIDCGYIPPCTGQIGDFVWQDNNGNGCQDAGEPGIPGVQVQLLSGCPANQVIQTTQTDSTGHYLFSGLCAGSYTVRFTTPNGFTHTVANANCNVNGQPPDSTDSDCACTGGTTPCDVCVTLATNQVNLTIDCGYIPPCTGTIGDFVWQDTNGNGCQDTGEPGIPGVQVDLYTGCGANKVFKQTTTTNASGLYLFTGLCAGDYTVCFHTPSGFTNTIVNSSACDTAHDSNCSSAMCDICVHLATDNSSDLTIDCGYIPGCPPCVNPTFGLGAGAAFSVFELGNGSVSVTGPAGGIINDVAIGPNGKLSMSGDEFVTGTIKLAPGATFSNSAHFTPVVQTNVDLTAAINAATSLSATDAALPCDQNFTKVDGSAVTNINATHAGVNVICIQDVTLSGKQVHINNPSNFANVTFVLNITGQFTLTGGGAGPQIRAGTNVKPADILYNLVGTTNMKIAFSGGGGGTNCCAAIVDGTLLAVNREIALSPGLVNGEIISGKNISIVSGSAIKCPPCGGTTPTPTPTSTPQTGNCTTTGKPNKLVMTYEGGSCASSQNSQGPPAFSVCQKFCCNEFSGGLTGATTVHIIVSNSSSTPTSSTQRYFDQDVTLGSQFTVQTGTTSTFGANTYFFIYEGGVLKQKVQLHTSCSAPLVRGETFGGVQLNDYFSP